MYMYPLAKGDPLCPLGFHPQVRWPTRCKRCFRDYKEHGGKRREEETLRRDDVTSSTPSLSSWSTSSDIIKKWPGGASAPSEKLKVRDGDNKRSWASSTNLALDTKEKRNSTSSQDSEFSNPSSWTSTPDLANLEDDTKANVPTINVTLPKRKARPIDTGQRTVSDSVSIKVNKPTIFSKNDSLAARAKKLQSIKEASSQERTKRVHVKEIKTVVDEQSNNDVRTKTAPPEPPKSETPESADSDDDTISLAGTETTDTTLVDRNDFDLREQCDSLKKELEETKAKCDRLEKEKGNILLRRLTAMDTTSSKTTELLKLQQKCNELQSQLEDYKDDKKTLDLRVKELEEEMESRPTAQAAQKVADELRSKLLAAETLCEELMDENEDMKKELRDLEDEMEEMQDNFREDQADEYTSLKKELEQTTKNCRILSFKLRKTERKAEELEKEKAETEKKLKELSGGQTTLNHIEKIKQLEKDLATANETSVNLQTKLDDTIARLAKAEEANSTTKKKAPTLSTMAKMEKGKVSRESLTRGGSQDDPAQLLRDLHDSLEREADLREQLKFAEEEAQNLRKKASRIEDDNESLVLQLKKMATRARTRKLSPNRLTPDTSVETDEGIAEDEDPANLKLQLELSEQEASVLRKKVEEFQSETDRLKKKTKELQDKLTAKPASRRASLLLEKGDDTTKKYLALEEEINELRKKLIEKERDCERLNAELSLTQKRSKGLQKTKSLDLDQQTLDLKRQLQLMEQETTVLRTKLQTLETENEKLSSENKKLQLLRGAKSLKSDKSLDKYIDKIAELEIELSTAQTKIKELEEKKEPSSKPENESVKMKKLQAEKEKLEKSIEKMKQDSASAFKDRIPKKLTELTTKAQLKTMVTDLEREISEMIVVLKNSNNAKNKFAEELEASKKNSDLSKTLKELEDVKAKLKSVQIELSEQKNVATQETKKYEDLDKKYGKIKMENDDLKSEVEKFKTEIKSTENELQNLKNELKSAGNLKGDMDKREKEISKLKQELDEASKSSKKDAASKTKQIEELEAQVKSAQDKMRQSSKTHSEELKKLEASLDEEKNKLRVKDSKQSELSTQWENERSTMSAKISSLTSQIDSLENTIKTKESFIEQLEETLRKERLTAMNKDTATTNKEISNLKEELMKVKHDLSETENKLSAAQKNKKVAEDKLKKLENELKTEKEKLDKKCEELETNLQSEKKKIEVMKTNNEKEQKNKELELTALKNKVKALELNTNMGNKKTTEIKTEYQERIDKMEAILAKGKQSYEDLTAKYEILEEEHVVTKAQLVMEKETINNQLLIAKRELEGVENELQTLRETYNNKNDSWIKEKLDMQEKLKDLEKRSFKDDSGNLEIVRLKAFLDEKQSELDQLKKEYDVIHDQMEYMRKESDELRKKLDDYDKVSKIQRNMSADSTAMDKEIKQLKAKLINADKIKKSDLAQCKMRYESQISVISDELQSLQNQVTRFKRERDTYKHMLEGAQKTIGDLKNSPAKSGRDSRASIASFDELEEWRSKVATLEQQISCMEDELSEARLESSKLKTELVSERSSWDIKNAELHSRVNELEEEKILSSGRTKIAGLRTRMELAWQKEREEQQRLLQETATLARDLRQTLFEVERERDKERLEAKRKQEQLKKSLEEDQEENKRKLTELQCDLLELRDAHAKLRTTNEKLRREKERHDKEREEMKVLINGRRRLEQEDDRRINALIEQVESLMQIIGGKEREDSQPPYTPTPPRRTKGPKSRESSPAIDRSREPSYAREDKKGQMQSAMQRIIDVTEELKRYQRLTEEDRERDRLKRVMGMRRATSTENDNPLDSAPKISRGIVRNGNTSGSLVRKSISLEHSIHKEQNIWKGDDDSLSSRQSLDMSSDVETKWSRRDTSLDSRLSGGSTQSESGEKRKKKGLMGKLKKLTKSRSIDDQDPGHFPQTGPLSSKPSSSSDVNEERGSKRDLKDRIKGIFKKSGSSSRSNSVERHDTSSTQRPLMRNGSNSNLSRSSPSPSPMYNSSSGVSDSSRLSKKPGKSK